MNDAKKPVSSLAAYFNRLEAGLAEKHPELAPVLRKLNTPASRLGILVAIIAVVAGMIYSNHVGDIQDAMRQDLQRVSDLQQIALAVQDRYNDTVTLPDTLKGLEDRPNPNYVRDNYLYDSETHRIYEYRVLDLTSYQLCSTFHYSTDKINEVMPSIIVNTTWSHDTGHQCFQMKVRPPPPKIKLLEP